MNITTIEKEIKKIQNKINKAYDIVNLEMIKINSTLTETLSEALGFNAFVTIDRESATFYIQGTGENYWRTSELNYYYRSPYSYSTGQDLPPTGELSWFSSRAKEDDTTYLEYLQMTGLVAGAMKANNDFIKLVQDSIASVSKLNKTYLQDLNQKKYKLEKDLSDAKRVIAASEVDSLIDSGTINLEASIKTGRGKRSYSKFDSFEIIGHTKKKTRCVFQLFWNTSVATDDGTYDTVREYRPFIKLISNSQVREFAQAAVNQNAN